MKKLLVIVIVLAALGGLGWQIYKKIQAKLKPAQRGPQSAAVPVEVAPVRKATIRDVGQFTGSLFAKYRFVVAPKVGGRLEKLPVNTGDVVRRGQLIATLEDEEYAQQLEESRAELLVAEANVRQCLSSLEVARREYDRAKSLFEKNIAAESDLDAKKAEFSVAEAKYSVAVAQVTQRKAALKAAEVRLSYTRIAGSWETGGDQRVVGERFVDEGAMLKANDPIVSILDISSLNAVIYVIERDYPKLRIGQQTLVTTDPFPGRTFAGQVVRIAPLLKETTRKASIEIEVPNPEGVLKPGMFIRTEIEFARHDNATVVGADSIVRRDGKRGVFMTDATQTKVSFVPVETGLVEGNLVEITDPALSGPVVVLGQHLLAGGAPISVPGAPKAEADTKAANPGRPRREGLNR